MRKIKRFLSVVLILAMMITGMNVDGLVLKVQAGQNEDGYWGMMLTEAEYRTLAYGMDDTGKEWYQYANKDNRYQSEQSTINALLQDLGSRTDFYWKEEDGNEA